MTSEPTDGSVYRDPVLIGVGAILLTHFVTAFRPGVTVWGIDYWSEFPLSVRIGMLAVGLIAVFPPLASRMARAVDRLGSVRALTWAAIAACAVVMLVFHSRALVYGDAHSILAVIQNPEIPALIGNLRFQPLDLYLHWGVYHYLVAPLGGTVAVTYAIIGALCGVAGIAALVRIARAITRDRAQRLFLILCGMTSGSVFLWFGHMESYTLAMTAILWAIALLLPSEEHPRRIALAWACWIIAVASHALALVILPALVWGSMTPLRTFARRSWVGRPVVLLVVGFALGLAAARYGEMHGLKTFVRLEPIPIDLYSAWSWAHIADVVNLLLFAAPFGVVALVLILTRRTGRRLSEPVELLAIASAALWVFAFWVDPMLGAFRDWDLLCGFGIALSVMCGGIVLERVQRVRPYWWVMVLVLALAHVGSWVAANIDLDQSARRVNRIVEEDMHYSRGYDLGGRRPAWALVLTKAFGWYDVATKHFQYRVTWNPSDAVSWANLAVCYQHRNLMDSAATCYGMAMKKAPDNPVYSLAYGQAEHARKNYRVAQVALERTVRQVPGLYEGHMALGMLYRDMGMPDKADEQAQLALGLDSTRADAHRLLEDLKALRSNKSEP